MFNVRANVWCAAAILAAMLTSTSPAEVLPDTFTGTWAITLTPDNDSKSNGAKLFEDAMVFEEGQLLTENFAFYGFEPGTYIIDAETPGAFSATLASGTQGGLVWSGAAGNSQINGTLAWTKKDGKVWTFTFTGEKK